MDKIEHECTQENRITRLENKTDKLDDKIDRIMQILTDNKAQLAKILTRLDKKRETDKEKSDAINKEEERIDRLEANDASRATQNKILLTLVTTLLVGFIIFMIEFQYKTYILHL